MPASAPPGFSARALLRKGRGPGSAGSRFVGLVRREMLPFWIDKGWDAKRGGFHERFFFDMSPDTLVERRVRVQWRQIYVLSHAYLMGWTDARTLALKGLEHVLDKAWAPDGRPGFVQALAPDGAVVNSTRDSYDHAFALLALSYLARASGDAQVRALVDLVLGYIDSDLTDAQGFLLESQPPALPRRQNPHMHMLEAMLALHETLAHPEAHARANRYRAMLDATFIDTGSNLLVEFFDDAWAPIQAGGGASVEPGHMAEWVWLIRRHERLFGLPSSPLGTHLLGAALRFSRGEHGFLIDEADTRQMVRKASRRLWPQTELAKAWLAEAETGTERAIESAEAVLDAMRETYLSGPFRGGWFDSYDAQGKVSIETVPASTLYHLFVAASEAERLLGA